MRFDSNWALIVKNLQGRPALALDFGFEQRSLVAPSYSIDRYEFLDQDLILKSDGCLQHFRYHVMKEVLP